MHMPRSRAKSPPRNFWRGMRIGYHNHFAEFSRFFDGRQAYEILLDLLDPRVVVELDAYWARMGGASFDPNKPNNTGQQPPLSGNSLEDGVEPSAHQAGAGPSR